MAEHNARDEQAMIERCRGLDVPTLVVHGAAELAGHLPWVEQDAAFSSILRQFLTSIPGSA